MFYSFRDNILFAHVARTGGVSVGAALRVAAPDLRAVAGQHASLAAARAELGPLFDEAFRFAIVRNPWDRLVSWQAFLARMAAGPEADPAALSDPGAPHWKAFDGTIAALAAETVEVEGVTRPAFSQVAQLSDAEGRLLTTRIGRFERLAEDFAEIAAAAGLRVPPLSHANRSEHLHYSAYFSAEGRELVAEAFAEDVAAFGYGFEAGAA